MNGGAEVLKSYLVSLGFKLDQPGLDKWKQELSKLDLMASKVGLPWVRAAATIASAIGSVTLATAGLLDHLAQTDLDFKKFALHMYMGEAAAKRLKIATDALGESLDDIAWMPELRGRFGELMELQKRLGEPSGYEQEMKHIRDIHFEFTKLKVALTVGAQYVGHYLYQYLNSEIKDFQGLLQKLNSYLERKMPEWTEKVANFLTHIINLGGSAKRSFEDVGGVLEKIWGSLGDNQKIGAIIAGLTLLFWKLGPFGKAIAILTTLIGLIDDFYAWLDGRKSHPMLAPVWDNLLTILRSISQEVAGIVMAFELIAQGKYREAWNTLKGATKDAARTLSDNQASMEKEDDYAKGKRQQYTNQHLTDWRKEAGISWYKILGTQELQGLIDAHNDELDRVESDARKEYQERNQRHKRDTEQHQQWIRQSERSGGYNSGQTDLSRKIVAGYDISRYAPGPHAERVSKIYEETKAYDLSSSAAIDAYIQKNAPGSPITGEMVLNASKKYGVEPAVLLAAMMQDSTIGTRGKAVRTFNPGNVGNDDAGNLRNYGDWQSGVYATAEWYSRHRVASTPINQDTSKLTEAAKQVSDAQKTYTAMSSASYPGPGGSNSYDYTDMTMAQQSEVFMDKLKNWFTGSPTVQVDSININTASNATAEEIGSEVKKQIEDMNTKAASRSIREIQPVF